MSTEETLREQQAHGDRVVIALDVCTQIISELENDCILTFRNSDIHDDGAHRACRYYIRVLDDVKERMRLAITKGENARKELIRLKEPSLIRKVI